MSRIPPMLRLSPQAAGKLQQQCANAERDKLFTLLRNAEKYRTTELNAFERRLQPPRAPRPWAMEVTV